MKYTSTVYREGLNDVEYQFDGEGYEIHANYHEPGDSEMVIETCLKFSGETSHGARVFHKYDVDTALNELASFEGKSYSDLVHDIFQDLWNSAELDDGGEADWKLDRMEDRESRDW